MSGSARLALERGWLVICERGSGLSRLAYRMTASKISSPAGRSVTVVRGLVGLLAQARPVLGDDLVEQCLFWLTALVAVRAWCRAGTCASPPEMPYPSAPLGVAAPWPDAVGERVLPFADERDEIDAW